LDGATVGEADLRLGYVRNTYYAEIGYGIKEEYRGQAYAQKAARLLFEVARVHKMPYLIIPAQRQRSFAKNAGAFGRRTAGNAHYLRAIADFTNRRAEEHCIFRFEL
jgi:predicted acetyltransferase